ncbi:MULTISPECIES: tRNA epoxyqueuosine(34) reductase QueG [Clostridium]|uniref:tRNA epoxyqueuosine(34) reductase QueG n=1 Tax=Clostridium TaxID=1485 RepID=UPI001C1E45A5|nr:MULTISPECIES: tRNA epoxyqueuosine(34) reductase QueG [Clostridium]MBU6134566.1 tRNA epoxyqueuosine(34) reductase QueG [Clostridium tertium]MDU3524511.1 tRNA epoxyqueuosine(34) reductase QueG [Clostridium sp.]MDU6362653.1 tRNA epoxyqueuosine(34) reductase QueG [Clostridium sp.]
MIKEDIINYCNSLGLDTLGFIKCREFAELKDFFYERRKQGLENEFEEKDIEKRINPFNYMSDGKTIISIAFPYLHDINYFDNGFSVYTRGKDYHKVVKSYLSKICEYIESIGGKANSFVDSNFLPERYIAYLAKVGFIGKNNMIITEKYGSYVFLGEIITDLEINCDNERGFNEISLFKECGECDKCYKSCPSKSINAYRKNSNICVSYFTQKKDLEDKHIKLLKGRVFGCDSCQNCCPYNEDISFSSISDFYPFDFMNKENALELANINNREFKETFLKTSCGWRGKNVLKRNALIKIRHNNGDISDIKTDSPYLKDYVDRLLNSNKI